MFRSDKNIYLQETEVKPNRYATYALVFSLIGILFCWLLNEIGLFRVGDEEMRIGSLISLGAVLVPLIVLKANHNASTDPAMKYIVIASASVFTLATTTLLTFHTTIMLLFPMFMGMLYRSKNLGRIAFLCATVCTVISPILGYCLHTWDIELFKELILIGTNGTTVIEGAFSAITWLSIGKIVLYLVLPRMIMVGSCSILMFYVIRVGVNHVNNQITLNDLSHRDTLTGLFNRNYLTDVLKDSSFRGNCGVFFFDVNGLKQINDNLGHEAGDLLLCKCADCLRGLCDNERTGAFRMGGDEFLMLILGIDENEAKNVISKLNDAMKEANESIELQQNNIRCSMAIGYAIGDFSESEKLIHMADANMYINKKAMRSHA